MSTLDDDVLAAMPGTMAEIGARVGLHGQVLWDTVHTLRKAGVVVRSGAGKAKVFSVRPKAEPVASGNMALDAKAEKKSRKRPVILCWVDGWPSQDPGRRMVWKLCWGSEATARRELAAVQKLLGDECQWELMKMTPLEARKLRAKGYELPVQHERKRLAREAASTQKAVK